MTVENTQDKASDPLAYLHRYLHVQLTTFRKNGNGVATPVWFAPDQGKLYVMTKNTTGKIKRIRNNGRVLLAPCNMAGKVLGEQIEARARELTPSEYGHTIALLTRKYGLIYRAFTLLEVNLGKAVRTYIEIEAR